MSLQCSSPAGLLLFASVLQSINILRKLNLACPQKQVLTVNTMA